MAEVPEVRRRHWADVAAILTGLMLMGLAIWPVPFVSTEEVRRVSVWWIYALAGGLSLVAVFLGQRWRFQQLAQGLLFAAVGVLLYELLCNGKHPYANGRPMVDEDVADPSEVRPDLSADLRDFLLKACASNRSERFSTAAEMAAELRRVRESV